MRPEVPKYVSKCNKSRRLRGTRERGVGVINETSKGHETYSYNYIGARMNMCRSRKLSIRKVADSFVHFLRGRRQWPQASQSADPGGARRGGRVGARVGLHGIGTK